MGFLYRFLKLNVVCKGKYVFSTFVGLQKFVMIFCSLSLLIGVNSIVVMRYFFKIDLHGINEIVLIFALWLYFTASSYATLEGSHITADVIPNLIKSKFYREVLNFVVQFIVVIVLAIFSYWSIDFLVWSFDRKPKTLVLDIPLYVSQASILVSFFLMCFFSFYQLIKTGVYVFFLKRCG